MTHLRKKVIVRTSEDGLHSGYLAASGFVDHTPGSATVALLNLAGRIESIPLSEIRYIAYVRDFNLADTQNPERLFRKTFLARPRTEGLWIRLTLLGGDLLEGLAATDLAFLDTAIADHGLFLLPPDVRSNTQRLFLPRSSIATLQLLAVITTPSKSKPSVDKPSGSRKEDLQAPLFPESNRT